MEDALAGGFQADLAVGNPKGVRGRRTPRWPRVSFLCVSGLVSGPSPELRVCTGPSGHPAPCSHLQGPTLSPVPIWGTWLSRGPLLMQPLSPGGHLLPLLLPL